MEFEFVQRRPRGPLGKVGNIRFANFIDGTSNTFLCGERGWGCSAGTWVGTRNPTGQGPRGNNYVLGRVSLPLNYQAKRTGNNSCVEGFSSAHIGGGQFLMADGSVRFISQNISFSNGSLNPKDGVVPGGFTQVAARLLGTYQKLGCMNDNQPVGNF